MRDSLAKVRFTGGEHASRTSKARKILARLLVVLDIFLDGPHVFPLIAGPCGCEQQAVLREFTERVAKLPTERFVSGPGIPVADEHDLHRGVRRHLPGGNIALNQRGDAAARRRAGALGHVDHDSLENRGDRRFGNVGQRLPASMGVRLPRSVCMPTWEALRFDQPRTSSTRSPAS